VYEIIVQIRLRRVILCAHIKVISYTLIFLVLSAFGKCKQFNYALFQCFEAVSRAKKWKFAEGEIKISSTVQVLILKGQFCTVLHQFFRPMRCIELKNGLVS
jgi:hypothetical protein